MYSPFTLHHVVPALYAFIISIEHQRIYFEKCNVTINLHSREKILFKATVFQSIFFSVYRKKETEICFKQAECQ